MTKPLPCTRLLRLMFQMRFLGSVLLLAIATFAQTPAEKIPPDDAIQIHEFYRLASQIQDEIWPNWSQVQTPLLLVTSDQEFLTNHPSPPKEFKEAGNGFTPAPANFRFTCSLHFRLLDPLR